MAYTPPLDVSQLLNAVKKYEKFFYVSVIFVVCVGISLFICKSFWKEKILWGIGSMLTMIAIISNRYYDIRKTANSANLRIDFANMTQDNSKKIKHWLKIEKIINYLWLIGALLIIMSRWILY